MNQQIYTEASDWLVEFRSGQPDYDSRKRFERWLSRSPEHVRAYLELTSVWETVGARHRGAPEEIDALVQRARSSAVDNVVRMTPPSAARYLARTASRRVALFAVAVVVAAVGASAYYSLRSDTYTTGIGEQRSVLLADGSTIDLNARSRVRVRINSRERHVDLLEGQALFQVAKDKARPFVVAADGTLVRAVGTQFDINERKRELIVTVVEGTVAVSRPVALDAVSAGEGRSESREGGGSSGEAGSEGVREGVGARPAHSGTHAPAGSAAGPGAARAGSNEILIDAGQRLTLSEAGSDQPTPATRPIDVATATAWTQRRLVFEATPLEDVIAEFNRNSQRLLVVRGHGLDDFHVSGAFSSTDVQPFLRFLRAQNGVEVIEQPDRIIITHR